jgi:hypothetical protein
MRAVLAWLIVGLVIAAEPPPVPDPYGLGERLALLDVLRETYAITPPAGTEVAELQRLYVAAWQRANGVTPDDPVATAERERRLRVLIHDRHGVEADLTLGEAALQELLHRLDDEHQRRDAEAIAAMVAADVKPSAEGRATMPSRAVPAAAQADASAERASASPAAAVTVAPTGKTQVRRLEFTAEGVTDCLLISDGERSALMVIFGFDHNGAFRGIPEGVWERLRTAVGIRRGILLLGHGTGTTINNESIESHLKANRGFYETMGGSGPAQPVECLIFASCSASNPDQMRAMRDGLGYYPTWRVATGPRAYATGVSILAALTDVASRPAAPAWRGYYRMGMTGDLVGAFGEVGRDGERAETTYWRLVEDQSSPSGWKTIEQR